MRKINPLFIILQIIGILCFLVCCMWTSIRKETIKKIPYGLSEPYFQVYLSYPYPATPEKKTAILEEFKYTISNLNMTLVIDNIDVPGIGVYDARGIYEEYAFEKEYPTDTQNYIYLLKNSYLYQKSVEQNKSLRINNISYLVKSSYNTNSTLYSPDHQYVYPILQSKSLNDIIGKWYVNTSDSQVKSTLIDFWEKHGFHYNFIKDESENTKIQLLSNLIFDKQILIMMVGFIIIISCYFILFYVFFINHRGYIVTHILFGATRYKLWLQIVKKWGPQSILGSLLGLICYYVIYSNWEVFLMTWQHALLSALIYELIIYILVYISYISAVRSLTGNEEEG